MKKKEIVQQCDTCGWWRQGDLINHVKNKGPCSWMVRDYDGGHRQSQIPFWANELAYQTISWEGKSCPAWEPKSYQKSRKKR